MLAAVAVVGVASLALTGCWDDGSSDAEPGTITVRLLGGDTPAAARDYLKTTFEAQNEGWTLEVEEAAGEPDGDAVAALSGAGAPDVVEIASTQVLSLADAGVLVDIAGLTDDLEADDLVPGLIAAGTFDDGLFAVPYIADPRVVLAAAPIAGGSPQTIDEYVAAGIAIRTDASSGIYAAGGDWRNALTYVWAHGGEIAVQQDGVWDAQLSSDESVAGLVQLQRVFFGASNLPPSDLGEDPGVPFCAGQVGLLPAPATVVQSILAPADAEVPGCPETVGATMTAFPLPGLASGEIAPTLIGGSSVAVTAQSESRKQAEDALQLMLSSEFQTLLAEGGQVPGRLSAASELPDGEVSAAQAAAMGNARFTPPSPKWIEVERSPLLVDAVIAIAQGADVAAVTAELDRQIEAILNG